MDPYRQPANARAYFCWACETNRMDGGWVIAGHSGYVRVSTSRCGRCEDLSWFGTTQSAPVKAR